MTPLRQQYLRIKKQFPDTIVMFRLGDFYETFNDDAKIVSSVCNIVLTGREMGTGNRVALAGVPYHAVDNYLARLIQAGHKVAIVEQTGTPEKVAGVPGRVLETREVARGASPQPLLAPKQGGGRAYQPARRPLTNSPHTMSVDTQLIDTAHPGYHTLLVSLGFPQICERNRDRKPRRMTTAYLSLIMEGRICAYS